MGLIGYLLKLTLTRLSGGWMTQIGWKYQELIRKYNIDLKLQKYIHINNSLHKDSEKIGLVKIKKYHIYNIVLCSSGSGPEMDAIQLINKFVVAMVLWDYILTNNGPAMTYLR